MELSGSMYLFALATVSITFVGFSSLLIVFRQTIGGELTRHDTYFTLSFIQIGFVVTAGSLLPPLLALYPWSHESVWRVSSAVLALVILWLVGRVPARRRAATGRSMPPLVLILHGIHGVSALALLLCTFGILSPGAAVYASVMTAVLFSSGIAYLLALAVLLPDLAKRQP